MSDGHEPFIKTPKQLITVIVLSFVLPIALIALLVKYVGLTERDGAGADSLTPEAISARIRPVAGFELVDASLPKELASGETVYKNQCTACHAAGVAGAPVSGDVAAWAPRIATGYEALLTSAVQGKGAMAAQAGGQYNETEIGRAVVYMVNAAGGSMAEPQAPAADAVAESAPAAGEAAAGATPPAAAAATTAATPAAAASPVAASAVAGAPAAETSAAPAGDPASAAPAAVAAVAGAATTAVDNTPAAAAPAPAAPAPAEAAPATESAAVAVAHDLVAGKALYDKGCMACHVAGVAGAPKFGDKAAWAALVPKGVDALAQSVITGKGAMPARGASTGTDEDIHAAVAYMLEAVK